VNKNLNQIIWKNLLFIALLIINNISIFGQEQFRLVKPAENSVVTFWLPDYMKEYNLPQIAPFTIQWTNADSNNILNISIRDNQKELFKTKVISKGGAEEKAVLNALPSTENTPITVEIQQVKSGNKVKLWEVEESAISGIAMDKMEKKIAIFRNDKINVYNTDDEPQLLQTFLLPRAGLVNYRCKTIQWSPDGKNLLALLYEREPNTPQVLYAYYFQIDSVYPVRIIRTTEPQSVIKWSPDGKYLAYIVDINFTNGLNSLVIADALTLQAILTIDAGVLKKGSSFYPHKFSHPEWSPDSKQLVITKDLQNELNRPQVILEIYGIEEKQLLRKRTVQADQARSLSWSSLNKLALASYDSLIRIMNMGDLSTEAAFKLSPATIGPKSVSWTDDGKYLIINDSRQLIAYDYPALNSQIIFQPEQGSFLWFSASNDLKKVLATYRYTFNQYISVYLNRTNDSISSTAKTQFTVQIPRTEFVDSTSFYQINDDSEQELNLPSLINRKTDSVAILRTSVELMPNNESILIKFPSVSGILKKDSIMPLKFKCFIPRPGLYTGKLKVRSTYSLESFDFKINRTSPFFEISQDSQFLGIMPVDAQTPYTIPSVRLLSKWPDQVTDSIYFPEYVYTKAGKGTYLYMKETAYPMDSLDFTRISFNMITFQYGAGTLALPFYVKVVRNSIPRADTLGHLLISWKTKIPLSTDREIQGPEHAFVWQSNDILHFTLKNNTGRPASADIYSLDGQKVYTIESDQFQVSGPTYLSAQIPLSVLPKGMYFFVYKEHSAFKSVQFIVE
jgi:hypothetical protein